MRIPYKKIKAQVYEAIEEVVEEAQENSKIPQGKEEEEIQGLTIEEVMMDIKALIIG